MTTVTILVENTVRRPGLLGEHGLAWWIDTGRHRVLFDTGQGMVLRHNAERLGIDLALADAVVLSHGHFDHVGGLEQVLSMAPEATLFLHPDAASPKYSGTGGHARRISVDYVENQRFAEGSRCIVWTREPAEVVPGIWVTGEIPRTNDFEDVGGAFFLDSKLTEPDPLRDDQALFFGTGDGVVLLLGCAHAGMVNTLRQVRRLTHDVAVRAMLGGGHLEAASETRLRATLESLRDLVPGQIGLNHCTGRAAIARIEREMEGRCIPAWAGAQWKFEGPVVSDFLSLKTPPGLEPAGDRR